MVTKSPLNFARLMQDDRYFFKHLIRIEDRNRKVMDFEFNPAQEILYNNLTGRDLVVKAGQMGITTFFLARYFKETVTHPGTTSTVVAHEEFLTQRLLHRTDVWYEMMPDEIVVEMPNGSLASMPKPRRQRNSSYEKTFPEINSVFYIGTARAYVFGRGEPIHRFLGSEVAFWPDPKRILDPTMQRVPLDGEMVLESTPNGEDNVFYEMVMEAYDDPNSRWTFHGLPWWLEAEYRIPKNSPIAPPIDRGELTLTSEELDIIGTLNWAEKEADERIRWRRLKIRELKKVFWQEFYEDITSCFLTTQQAYYDVDELERLRRNCYPHNYMWHQAKIWNAPDQDWDAPNYFISVDPGQGKLTLSVATVWRIEHEGYPLVRHEATLAGLYDPTAFAPMVVELAEYYRGAKISAERNGHGLSFCAQISDYNNLYRQTDIVSGISTKVIGWATTGAAKLNARGTKIFMLDELNHLLPDLECHDEEIISQISRVRVGGDGKIHMPKFDDFHDSVAIMAATRSSAQGHVTKGMMFKKGPLGGWRY